MSNESTCVVYLITCKTCSMQYIGSTLKTRIRRHLSDVNSAFALSRNISAVLRHCIDVHRCDTTCLEIQSIEKVNTAIRGGDHIHKLRREAYWLFVLKTCSPNGPNKRADPAPHHQTPPSLLHHTNAPPHTIQNTPEIVPSIQNIHPDYYQPRSLCFHVYLDRFSQ